MQINLIAVGTKMPGWISEGYYTYVKRFPIELKLQLIEISTLKRQHSNLERIIEIEGEKMLAAVPKGSFVIALDELGKQWDSITLANHLRKWRDEGKQLSLLIGGPEGLATKCLKQADLKWSLSALTFPHPLVRVILAEQLYRAFSILNHHPYHKA